MFKTSSEQKPIEKLLVANRGEIAVRILNTCRELSIETYALTTPSDALHSLHADHVLPVPSAATFVDVAALFKLIRANKITHIHPGYGFLSESPEFARRAWTECNAVVIGPGSDVLEETGDKLAARLLAQECSVPVLAAMTEPTDDFEVLKHFAARTGYPIMLKAVDGGGGRGIRLVREVGELATQARVAIAESPTRKVFAERAAVDGFRHVEVQIIGDGTGAVRHIWERECSIQRRYQKIVEFAPASQSFGGRRVIEKVISAALLMAEKIKYKSLGTFEFLAEPNKGEFFFLEINPRLQVEHTITEQICGGIDLVALQLRIAQGATLEELEELGMLGADALKPPHRHSIQLRVTAENPKTKWTLSVGKISSFKLPSGNGVRVDTALHGLAPTQITPDFDSLIAKIIVTASTWPGCVAKAQRALQDCEIEGVATNLDILRAIVNHDDFRQGRCDTSWLEKSLINLQSYSERDRGQKQQMEARLAKLKSFEDGSTSLSASSSSTVLLRKGDAWTVKLEEASAADGRQQQKKNKEETHHLKLLHLARNEFPTLLSATIAYATPDKPDAMPLNLTLISTRASASAVAGSAAQRRGDASDARHVIIPFAGKLIEVCVDEGDWVKEGDVICVVSQMKMELTVCASRPGRVAWLLETEEGEDVAEGALAAELDLDGHKDSKKARL